MSALFFPVTTRRFTISSRIVVLLVCRYLAEKRQGDQLGVIHFDGLASCEASLLSIDGTGMEPEGVYHAGRPGVMG